MNTQIDWPTLLNEIAYLLGDEIPGCAPRIPVGTRLLSDHLKVPRGTLRNWLDGGEPRHSDGEAILLVWCRLTSKAPEFAPRMSRILSAAQVR